MSQTEAYNYPGVGHLFKVPECTGADLLFRLSMRSPKTECITLCQEAQIIGSVGIISQIYATVNVLIRRCDAGFPAICKAVQCLIIGRGFYAHHTDDRVEQIVV